MSGSQRQQPTLAIIPSTHPRKSTCSTLHVQKKRDKLKSRCSAADGGEGGSGGVGGSSRARANSGNHSQNARTPVPGKARRAETAFSHTHAHAHARPTNHAVRNIPCCQNCTPLSAFTLQPPHHHLPPPSPNVSVRFVVLCSSSYRSDRPTTALLVLAAEGLKRVQVRVNVLYFFFCFFFLF